MARAKSPPPPPPKPPVITPEEGIVLLEELIERGKALRAPTSAQLDAFRAAVSTALEEAFGSESELAQRANNAGSIGFFSVSIDTSEEDWTQRRREQIEEQSVMLVECISQLKRMVARASRVATGPASASPETPPARGNMATQARQRTKVFIGHGGRSQAWRDLKDLLQDRLHLKPDEFNMEPAAGMTTKERLEEMLNAAAFAFLVMTGEDEHSDKTTHARENVIHEVGLFQGALGFRRAIVVLEEGCAEFSNIQGITQLRFPKGNIKAISEEIRRVLEREGLLPGQ
jgi:predicted nucleotide-binding protein